MFGSEVVAKVLYRELLALPAVTEAIGQNLTGLPVLPQAMPLPAAAFYAEQSQYDWPLGGDINAEQFRFRVKLMCAGQSTSPIFAAAHAQRSHFHALVVADTEGERHYQMTFSANGEVLPTTVVDGDTYYRQLGTVYDVTLMWG